MKLWNQEEISTYMYTDARNPFANIAMIGNSRSRGLKTGYGLE